MKTQNNEISANDEDNRNSQKHNIKVSSRKRDEPEDKGEAEHENEESNAKKRARVASLPEPEPGLGLGQVVELPASFNTLDDDCLDNVLEFVGKKSYSVFGRVNKTCHEMFCSKGYPKITYIFGYGPLQLIQQRGRYNSREFAKGVLHYNRRDIFEWILAGESDGGFWNLKFLCCDSIEESRLDILREVFDRVNGKPLEYLRDCKSGFDLCHAAARDGKLECLKYLRENECAWSKWTWERAKHEGHEHILDYLRNNGFPTEWQN